MRFVPKIQDHHSCVKPFLRINRFSPTYRQASTEKQVRSFWEASEKFSCLPTRQVRSFASPESIREEAKLPTYPLIINENTSKCAPACRETKKLRKPGSNLKEDSNSNK